MKNSVKALFFVGILFFSSNSFSQTEEKGTKEEKGPHLKKTHTKIQEVVNLDSTSANEILKRAVNWVKEESARFIKTNGTTTGSKAECVASFTVKPKELNPQADFTGKITMHVTIDCKENKYRYVISKLVHTATNGESSGGDIDNIIPDCGGMHMPENTWKKLKGEALKSASMIVSELKDAMYKSVNSGDDKW